MRAATGFISVLGFVAATLAARPASASADRVLARVQAAEERLRDVTVAFRQTTLLKALGDRQTTEGEVALLRKPERFRVTFTLPVPQEATYDGERLWLWLPGTGQAFRQAATPEDLGRLLGINPAAPARSFSRGYRAALEGCGPDGCHLTFTRTIHPPMTWHVRVGATDWRLAEAWYEDEEVRVSIACFDYRVNRGLKPNSFVPNLPGNVDVVDGIPFLFGGGAGAR